MCTHGLRLYIIILRIIITYILRLYVIFCSEHDSCLSHCLCYRLYIIVYIIYIRNIYPLKMKFVTLYTHTRRILDVCIIWIRSIPLRYNIRILTSFKIVRLSCRYKNTKRIIMYYIFRINRYMCAYVPDVTLRIHIVRIFPYHTNSVIQQ